MSRFLRSYVPVVKLVEDQTSEISFLWLLVLLAALWIWFPPSLRGCLSFTSYYVGLFCPPPSVMLCHDLAYLLKWIFFRHNLKQIETMNPPACKCIILQLNNFGFLDWTSIFCRILNWEWKYNSYSYWLTIYPFQVIWCNNILFP